VASNNNAVADLAWECLRIPTLRVTAGLTLKQSVVRKVADPVSLASHTVEAPLRVLQVRAEPVGRTAVRRTAGVAVARGVRDRSRKGVFMQGWDGSAWVTFASDMADLPSSRLRLPVRG
jgi:hypothetical protein